MSRLEGWGFVCLMSCAVTVVLSMSLFTGLWQAIGCGVGAVFGILSGGLYAASVRPRSQPAPESGDAADSAGSRA